MERDPIAILKDVGKHFGRRVSSTNLFDANVCTSPRNPERPWEVLSLPGDIFRHKLSLTLGDHKVTLLANGDFIQVQVKADLDVPLCSLNRRDKIFQLHRVDLHVPGFPSLPVFSRESDSNLVQFIRSATLQRALNLLRLGEQESLHVYRNGLILYLQRDSRDEIILAAELVCKMAEQLPVVEQPLDLSELPSKFETLLELIPKWALSDDEERSEMLAESPIPALREFVAAVSPHIPAINQFLDSFGDEPPSEGAVALSNLAQCCLEAQFRIRDNQEN